MQMSTYTWIVNQSNTLEIKVLSLHKSLKLISIFVLLLLNHH
jgi:hypothetical protein